MAFPRWATALGATLLLSAPAWAAPQKAETLEFSLSIESIAWTSSGFVVKTTIENRTGSPELFLHHAPNQSEPEAYVYDPTREGDAAGKLRRTYTLTGLKSAHTAATLAFGVAEGEEAGLLVVGESRPPFRQVAIALKPLLPERPVTARPVLLQPPAPSPAVQAPAVQAPADAPPAPIETPAASAEAAPAPQRDPGVIMSFTPPHATFGERILLKEGKPGAKGEGWSRIYMELPDISLTELQRVVESPAQIWQGEEGHLYLRNVGGQRALAVEIRDARIISARYVTPQTLSQVLGPKTRFPRRVYMGRP